MSMIRCSDVRIHGQLHFASERFAISVTATNAATPPAVPSTPLPVDARQYAAALIKENGARYGEILRQLDALQAKPETVEFGKAVEAEVRNQLGHNAAKLNTASYRTGNNVFSRNGQTPDQMRAAAEIDTKRPVGQRTGAYDRYVAEDKAHGDGKFATNDAARINDGWRSMIASGARTPAEFTRLARTADGQLNASIAAAQNQFSTAGFQALGADKLASGFINGLTQAERLDGKDWAQDVGLLLRKGPEVVAAFQWGVAKGA